MPGKNESPSLSVASPEWGSGHETAVILAAAFRHSDGVLRSALRERVQTWVHRSRPLHDAKTIAQVLREHTGTALEPFRLSDEPLELSVLAVQAAFSEAANCPFVRIVSEETIGFDGGLVLSRSLESRYLERFAFAAGKRTPAGARDNYIAPAEVLAQRESPGALSRQSIKTSISISDNGFTVRVRLDEPVAVTGITGEILGSSKALGQWGIWMRRDQDGILLGSINTDAFLKLCPHLMDRPVLRISIGESSGLFLQLRMPESEPARLPAILLRADTLAASCSLKMHFDILLTPEERLAIARDIQPPSRWITSEFLEAWSETV